MNTALPLSRRAAALACYLAGLLVYGGSLYVSAKVNPRDIVNGSWADPHLKFTLWTGFALCLVAPFLSVRPLPARVGFCVLGLLPLCVAWYLWWTMTA